MLAKRKYKSKCHNQPTAVVKEGGIIMFGLKKKEVFDPNSPETIRKRKEESLSQIRSVMGTPVTFTDPDITQRLIDKFKSGTNDDLASALRMLGLENNTQNLFKAKTLATTIQGIYK